ncbi:MAG: hypothetical protein ACLVJH_01680 [Faecalibacterium prausnitzii]
MVIPRSTGGGACPGHQDHPGRPAGPQHRERKALRGDGRQHAAL